MTNRKNDNDEARKGENWEFTVASPKVKTKEHDNSEGEARKIKSTARKNTKLTLDEAAIPRAKTRSAMALELQGGNQDKSEDSFNYAPIPKRAIAFALDALFIVLISIVVKYTSPLLRQLIELFLNKYKLQFMIPEVIVMKIIMGVSAFSALFFLIVIPLAFFNVSFGKKMLGLRVRGSEMYTLSISQSFKRELIMKPISMLIIAGFITPFFSKKHLSIHDMLTNTIVIED